MLKLKLFFWFLFGGNLDIEKYKDYPRYEEVLVFFKNQNLPISTRKFVVSFLSPTFLKVLYFIENLKMKKREMFDFLNWKQARKTKLFTNIMPFSKLLLGQKDRDLFTYENLSYQDLLVLSDIIEEYLLSTDKFEKHEKFRNEFFKRVKTKKPES
ncbi:MAG: hypothetical protein PHO23_01120 [Candidatus Pacebacteria bacterium]|nr:hypothetical protein [Candidatus Paceibacterota bacterium]